MTESDVVIRPLEAADEPGWRRLWTDYLSFYETARPEDVYETSFSRLIGDDPKDFRGLIALANGKPVGLVHYLFHRHGWNIGDTCYMQDLYVDASMRGKGLGRRLIEAVYAEADAYGAASTYWLTQEFNVQARKLYDRVGQVTPFIKYDRA